MTFIIVNTTNSKVENLLYKWFRASSDTHRQSAKKYFIRKFGSNSYLMKANAATLALLYDLKIRYGNSVYIFVADTLEVEPEFPKEVIKVVKECRKKQRNLQEKDLRMLEEIQINCSVNWNQK